MVQRSGLAKPRAGFWEKEGANPTLSHHRGLGRDEQTGCWVLSRQAWGSRAVQGGRNQPSASQE